MPQDNAGTPDGGSGDIAEILGLTSEGSSETDLQTGDTQGQEGATPAGQGQGGFKFGGQSYRDQAEAEKAFNLLRGKYSDQQGVVNRLKAAIRDGDTTAIEALAKHPEWRDIIGKVMEQEAEEESAREEEENPDGDFDWSSVPAPLARAYEEMEVARNSMALDREETLFEKKLGRAVTAQEHNEVMRKIARIGDLTYEQAWVLSFHDKMMKDAITKSGATGKGKPGARPKPQPFFMPGVKVDQKKNPADMNNTEFREHLRTSPEFQQLMGRE